MKVAIDHWYHLHTRLMSDGNPERATGSEGPFDHAGLVNRVQEVLALKTHWTGGIVHWAQVTRVEVGCGRLLENRAGKWEVVNDSAVLERLPKLVSQLKAVESRVHGYLVFGFLNYEKEAVALRAFVSSEVANEPEDVLLLGQDWGPKLLVLEADLAPENEIGIDLMSVWNSPVAKRFNQRWGMPLRVVEPSPRRIEFGGVPVVGFRRWRLQVPSQVVDGEITSGAPSLFGPHYATANLPLYEWTDAEKMAKCGYHDHPAPDLGCNCGVYALHHLDYARKYRGSAQRHSIETEVVGAVLGSGEMFVYEEGWRAEAARIIGFDADSVDHRFMPALQEVSGRFDVPILSPDRLVDAAVKRGRMIEKRNLQGM